MQKVKVFKESHSGSKAFFLLLQCMHTIEIFLQFLKAERSSNRMLHLHTVREIMSFFVASGHLLYEKSSYMYLKTRCHPDVQRICQNGFHTIRKSDTFWTGLSSDPAIERTLMDYPGTWN